jgi:hypothetical protein
MYVVMLPSFTIAYRLAAPTDCEFIMGSDAGTLEWRAFKPCQPGTGYMAAIASTSNFHLGSSNWQQTTVSDT